MLLDNIGVFVPAKIGQRPPPSDRPITRAVSRLLSENIRCIFGFSFERQDNLLLMEGLFCDNNNWIACKDMAISAVHDRFPSQLRSQQFNSMTNVISPTAMGNPLSFTLLCRDKVKTQLWLEKEGLRLPELETNVDCFKARMSEWGDGIIKPRFGALGTNVQKVNSASNIPHKLAGVDPKSLEPSILQRAIPPPKGFAGMSVRCLIQRQSRTEWTIRPAVLRLSKTDPIVNVARGAEAYAADDLLPKHCMNAINEQAERVGEIINRVDKGYLSVECGIDFVIDQNHAPWIVELNSRPRGRLEYLAVKQPERFYDVHVEALAQPIRYLAGLEQKKG